MTPFERAYAEARRKWERGEGGPTFSYGDKKYSVSNREEAARQKEMAQSPMRGRGYGGRAETPAPAPAPAPAPRARASASDIPGLIARGMSEGADRVPSGRGLGAAFTAAGAANAVGRAAQAAAAKAAPAAKRVEPLMYTSRGEKGKFVPSSAPKGGAKAPERQDPPMYKKGGLVTKAKQRG